MALKLILSLAQWASGTGVGATLTLTWPYSITVTQVVLYDRPNLNDQITGGVLTFSDGTSVAVGSLNNDGSATVINLATPVTTSSLRFAVTSVSDSTGSAGLAEMQVYSSATISGGSTVAPPATTSSGAVNGTTSTVTSASSAPSSTPTGVDLARSAIAVASSQSDDTRQVSRFSAFSSHDRF